MFYLWRHLRCCAEERSLFFFFKAKVGHDVLQIAASWNCPAILPLVVHTTRDTETIGDALLSPVLPPCSLLISFFPQGRKQNTKFSPKFALILFALIFSRHFHTLKTQDICIAKLYTLQTMLEIESRSNSLTIAIEKTCAGAHVGYRSVYPISHGN